MANGVITFLKRLVAPSAPVAGKSSIYIDDSGATPEPKIIDDNGIIYGFKGVFGDNFSYGQSLIEASNATNTPQPYTTAVFTGLDISASARYLITCGFTCNYSVGTRDFIGQLNLSGGSGSVSGLIKNFRLEQKDAGNDQRSWAYGEIILTGPEIGVAGNLIFEFQAQNNGDTATVFDGLVTIKRVV